MINLINKIAAQASIRLFNYSGIVAKAAPAQRRGVIASDAYPVWGKQFETSEKVHAKPN